jgi:hypothetical protein
MCVLEKLDDLFCAGFLCSLGFAHGFLCESDSNHKGSKTRNKELQNLSSCLGVKRVADWPSLTVGLLTQAT